MKYKSVKNLKYVNAEHTLIECTVDFTNLGELPFCADKNDIEAHGREIFEKAKRGDFGSVGAYTQLVRKVVEKDNNNNNNISLSKLVGLLLSKGVIKPSDLRKV